MTMTRHEIAEYCKKCYYYRGATPYIKQCYYRVWEEQAIKPPSQVLRFSGRCDYAKRVKRA
jgi:hypothetical protein